MIPYGRQSISQDDIDAVVDVLRSDFLTQGPATPAFERAVADYCGVDWAVAANSATSSLHLACLALGLGPGDRLWTTPNTFVASANCARFCGAEVDFIDIDPGTWNLSVQALRERLVAARRQGRLPKVVVPVAFAGQSCAMAEVRAMADEFGFRILEDASHAIGGRYHRRPVGCGDWADITVFSFHPVKIVTTGEGGMAVTSDRRLAERMTRLRSHGITRAPAEMETPPEGDWCYEMQELGWNYRMTDIQAALGRSQMQRLDAFVAVRAALALRYDALLADSGLTLPRRTTETESAWHLYVVGLDPQAHRSRIEVFRGMREAGIGVNVHYLPVHLQPYYRRLGFAPGYCPVAEDYARCALTLPLHPQLSAEDQTWVVDNLLRLIGRARG